MPATQLSSRTQQIEALKDAPVGTEQPLNVEFARHDIREEFSEHNAAQALRISDPNAVTAENFIARGGEIIGRDLGRLFGIKQNPAEVKNEFHEAEFAPRVAARLAEKDMEGAGILEAEKGAARAYDIALSKSAVNLAVDKLFEDRSQEKAEKVDITQGFGVHSQKIFLATYNLPTAPGDEMPDALDTQLLNSRNASTKTEQHVALEDPFATMPFNRNSLNDVLAGRSVASTPGIGIAEATVNLSAESAPRGNYRADGFKEFAALARN